MSSLQKVIFQFFNISLSGGIEKNIFRSKSILFICFWIVIKKDNLTMLLTNIFWRLNLQLRVRRPQRLFSIYPMVVRLVDIIMTTYKS
jgi:hypothetical protein